MLKSITLENFKCFGSPTKIELAPITLIFGQNSSGKSAILKSIYMLLQTFAFGSPESPLLLNSRRGYVDLGSYEELIFDHNLAERKLRIRLDVDWRNSSILEPIREWFATFGGCEAALQLTFNAGENHEKPYIDQIELFVDSDETPVATFELRNNLSDTDIEAKLIELHAQELIAEIGSDRWVLTDTSSNPKYWRMNALHDLDCPDAWKDALEKRFTIEAEASILIDRLCNVGGTGLVGDSPGPQSDVRSTGGTSDPEIDGSTSTVARNPFAIDSEFGALPNSEEEWTARELLQDDDTDIPNGDDFLQCDAEDSLAKAVEDVRDTLQKNDEWRWARADIANIEQTDLVRNYVNDLRGRLLTAGREEEDISFTQMEYFLPGEAVSAQEHFHKYSRPFTPFVRNPVGLPIAPDDPSLFAKLHEFFQHPSGYFVPRLIAEAVGLEVASSLLQPHSIFPAVRPLPKRWYVAPADDPNDEPDTIGQNMPEFLYRNPKALSEVNDCLYNTLGIDYRVVVERANTKFAELFEMRLEDLRRENDTTVSFADVGIGISQLLPILVRCLSCQGQSVLVEQPELHLHPRLQADFGSFLAETIKSGYKNRYVIETHSEHLILRIKRLVREGVLKERDVSILFVERTESGSQVSRLALDSNGKLLNPWPGGFFVERLKEM